MSAVYLIGHKNPDTDSISSSIAYAKLKSLTEPGEEFIPGRLGEVNRETRFVLDYFEVSPPRLIDNVFAQVSDVPFDKALTVRKEASMRETWALMLRESAKTVNVVDESGRLSGLVTLGDIAEAYLESEGHPFNEPVPISNIATSLGGTILLRKCDFFAGRIDVWTGPGSDRRAEDVPSLVIWDGEGLSEIASPTVKVLVVAGGKPVPEPVMRSAETCGMTVISTGSSVYEAVRLVGQSEPVSRFMTSRDLVTFDLDDLIDDVRQTVLRYKYRNFPILDEMMRPVGMLARRHLLDYSGKKVILVDHNERSQSVEGIEQATVLEIIDHHRIATIETEQPIVFINRPLGCTATIVSSLYDRNGIRPEPSIAGIMCAAILSDTLAFKSPTCTSEDVHAAEKLAALAGIDMSDFAKRMFEAGTSLDRKSEPDIFYSDFKETRVGEYRIGVSQVNIYNTDLGPLKVRLMDFMEKERTRRRYNVLVLMLTDIINEGSELLVSGDLDLIQRAFDLPRRSRAIYLKGVVSRKKQVMPRIVKAANSQ